MASSVMNVVLDPEAFEQAKVDVDTYLDGHIAAVRLLDEGPLTLRLQASGDGSRTLAEGFRLLADKVEQSHAEWLRTKAAEQ